MSKGRYWLYEWLDGHSITDPLAAERVLASSSGVQSLRDAAKKAHEQLRAPVTDTNAIVAGSALDLTGSLDCMHWECRVRQVDKLIRHTWHYFDKVIVADDLAYAVAERWDQIDPDAMQTSVDHTIRTLLYLRETGADALMEFRQKPPACQRHWIHHAKELGLESLLDEATAQVKMLVETADIAVERDTSTHNVYRLQHPAFEHTIWDTVPRADTAGLTPGQIKEFVATGIVARFMAHLTSDVWAARGAHLPLGSAVKVHRDLLERRITQSFAQQVAFELDLPILRNVPVEVLIEVRDREWEAFDRFKNALRNAVLTLAKEKPSARVPELRDEIQQGVILPALRDIRDRLESARAALVSKSIAGVAIGSLATACGLVAGILPGVAIGAAIAGAAGTTATGVTKYIDDRREQRLANMYFLWAAIEHGKHGDVR